jgi:fructose-specific phosphotransferase system IIC component
MTAHEHSHTEVSNKNKRRQQNERAEHLTRLIRILTGALIGSVLTVLFSIVIFAFVVKAFITSEEMALHLLNSAVTLVGTTLGAVLGYILGHNSNDKPQQGP